MPKPKSEKTLLKEQALREKILKYEDGVNLSQKPGLSPIIYAGKVKSPHEQVVVRKVQFISNQAAYLRKLHKTLVQREGFLIKPQQSYLVGSLAGASPLKIIQPQQYIPARWDYVTGACLRLMQGAVLPTDQVLMHPYTDEAVAWEWPDDLGKSKVYMHVGSYLLRMKFPKLAPQHRSDGLNRAALKDCSDWGILSEYIQARKTFSSDTPVDTVCEIVRTISLNLLAIEQKKEAEKLKGKW